MLALQALGTETIAPVRPHETVFVRGGGGFIQKVPWNVPGFGETRVRIRRRVLPDPISQVGTTTQLGDLGVLEEVERLANVIRWTGIGILTLAGAVLVFKLTDLFLER